MIEDVTVIMVCYNTKDLARKAYESVRKFYPDISMIIVDNSDRNDPCTDYVAMLKSGKTRVIRPGRNIGHGPGMDTGIRNVGTRYALLMDSDVVIRRDCISAMIKNMGDGTFGVGKIVHVSRWGNSEGKPAYMNPKAIKYYAYYGKPGRKHTIPYLHPYFHLINVEKYRKLKPYVHHGAPCVLTMLDLYNKGRSRRVLVNFPVEKYVAHRGRGTRENHPLDFRKHRWQKV